MTPLIAALTKGGPLMVPLLLTTVLGLAATAALGALTGSGRQVPVFVWLAAPVGVMVWGFLGCAQSLAQVDAALLAASADTQTALSLAGSSTALFSLAAGLVAALVLFGSSTLAVSLGAVASSRRAARTDLRRAGVVAGIGVLTGAGVLLSRLGSPATHAGVLLGLGLILGGPLVALSVLHQGEGETLRALEVRLAASASLLFFLVSATLFGHLQGHIVAWEALQHGSAELAGPLATSGFAGATHAVRLGAASTVGGLALGMVSVFTLRDQLAARRSKQALAAAAATLLVLAAGHLNLFAWAQRIVSAFG